MSTSPSSQTLLTVAVETIPPYLVFINEERTRQRKALATLQKGTGITEKSMSDFDPTLLPVIAPNTGDTVMASAADDPLTWFREPLESSPDMSDATEPEHLPVAAAPPARHQTVTVTDAPLLSEEPLTAAVAADTLSEAGEKGFTPDIPQEPPILEEERPTASSPASPPADNDFGF